MLYEQVSSNETALLFGLKKLSIFFITKKEERSQNILL